MEPLVLAMFRLQHPEHGQKQMLLATQAQGSPCERSKRQINVAQAPLHSKLPLAQAWAAMTARVGCYCK
jgi:hypothetical protein